MDLRPLMEEMETLGTEQNRKIYRRHGVASAQFGLSFANLKKLQKRLKKDHPLALELWATANHDCRILATLIANPKETGDILLEHWRADLDNYIITDSFSGFVGQTSLSQSKAEEWTARSGEWTGRAGWHLIAHLAMKNQDLPDCYFQERITFIETNIHLAKNRVKDAMNNALIAIGMRNPTLMELAIAAAQRIGKVDVDHGETSCKTPDAVAYIRKAVARKESRGKKN